jgi:ubiquinone biosynthesis monooxygenase Coq7
MGMQGRNLTPLDRMLSGVNNALRTVATRAGKSPRPYPAANIDEADLDQRQRAHAAGLMRVNHAGEVAAQGLYQGHAAVAKDHKVETQMQRAANEEFDHLAWCEQRIDELGERPSRLSPLWYGGAFVMGAASGMFGDKWSLGFIAETEQQVCDHLDSHLARLPANDARSRAIVTTMRDEEAEHGQNAMEAGAAKLPRPLRHMMKLTARLMTTTAYRV